MKRLGYFSVLFLGLSAGLFAQKTRVAVLNFDYGTVQSSVASIFGTNQDIGKGIADMLVDRFVQGAVSTGSSSARLSIRSWPSRISRTATAPMRIPQRSWAAFWVSMPS